MPSKRQLAQTRRWTLACLTSALVVLPYLGRNSTYLGAAFPTLMTPSAQAQILLTQILDTPASAPDVTSDTSTDDADPNITSERPKILNRQGRWILGVVVLLSAGIWGTYWLRQTRDPDA
jgi:hypothetical protein